MIEEISLSNNLGFLESCDVYNGCTQQSFGAVLANLSTQIQASETYVLKVKTIIILKASWKFIILLILLSCPKVNNILYSEQILTTKANL